MSLFDPFHRPHDYLRISLTERCNLRCVYCMPAEGVQLSPASHLMTADEIVGIAQEFVALGVKKVRLTGGEPLVRKDADEIMLRLSKLPIQLTLTTNALLVDRYLACMKEAGIQSLNVSLDTLQEERFRTFTRRGGFRKTLKNIDLLLQHGFHTKINVVLMKGKNEDEVLDFIEWTRDKKLHVRFIEFMPFDGNEWQWEKIVSYQEILDTIAEKYEFVKLQDQPHATTKGFQVDGFAGTFAVISSMTNHFCGSCNRMRLTANGKMKNCLFSNEEEDLLTPYRAGKALREHIQSCLDRKYAKHAGIPSLEKLSEQDDFMSKRSMILIGG